MNDFLTLLLLVVGELAGDATFFFKGTRRRNKTENTPEEKRKQYRVCKYSLLLVILTIMACAGLKGLIWFPQVLFPGAVFGAEILRRIFDCLGKFSSTAVFMLIYCKCRKVWKDKYYQAEAEPSELKDDPNGIYVWDDLSGNYVLSEKWVYIKDCTIYILMFNFLFLGFMNIVPGMRTLSGSIIALTPSELIPWELIPIGASTILLEFYNYLAFDDRRLFSFRKKKKKNSADPEFDLWKYKADYEKKKLPGLVSPLEIRRHGEKIKDSMRDYMEQCRGDSDPFVRYFIIYLEKQRWSKGRHYHVGCLETAVRVIKGENLFCASPFYKDIDVSIFFPVFVALMKGNKALILLEDRGNLQEFAGWVKEGIDEIQGLDDFWRISILNDAEDDTDVGILSFQDIYRPTDFHWLNVFFRDVTVVVVIEASNMLAGGQEAISNLSEKIGREPDGCTWLLCDNNAESMLDLFSHLLNKKFAYISATPLPAKETLTGFWNVEEEEPHPWKPVQHYLGAEIQAAEVAWNNALSQLVLYGEEIIPIYDLKWILGQYYLEFHNRTKKEPYQYILDNSIRMEIAGNACMMARQCFLIVEDYNFNLYEIARQYVTRASEKAIVHVMSPNYLLRNFMRSREADMYADPKYIAQFVPEYVNTKRNAAVRMVRKMLHQPVAESEIRNELEKCEDWDGGFNGLEDLKKMVRFIVPMVKDFEEDDFQISLDSHFDNKEGRFIQEKCYQIHSSKIKKQFIQYFQKACYVDENGRKRHISKLILAGHLDQKYLKGQFAIFNGLYYKIVKRGITDYEYVLQVHRASEQISGRKYYRQNRMYRFKNMEEYLHIPVEYENHKISLIRCRADILADTLGYYVCNGWNEIASAVYIMLDQDEQRRRGYISKQFLKVDIPVPEGMQEEKTRIVAVQMACLLQESFCTFYPQQYYLLSVALDRRKYENAAEEEMLKGVLSDAVLQDEKGSVCFYIIEDSMEDMGVVRSIEKNFGRILMLLSEYVKWSQKSEDDYLLFGRNV